MGRTLTCLNCKVTCCDDFEITYMRYGGKKVKHYTTDDGEKIKIKDPKKYKVGDLLEIHGITIVKKENGFWACKAFNQETRKCMIYDYRPYMCRSFVCRYFNGSRKNKIDKIKNYDHYVYLTYKSAYDISLTKVYEKIEKIGQYK